MSKKIQTKQLNKERAITYSLLAHIRNSGTLAKGPLDIFIPLIKRTLSKMNSEGIFKGESLLEIKNVADELYSIDFPIPVLKKILREICNEVNTDDVTHFELYQDGAFSLNQYSFTEYEDTIEKQKAIVESIETLFKEFCDSSEIEIKDSESIFKFIEKNKFNLSRYLSHSKNINGEHYTAEAQFVDFFRKIPQIYDKIKEIYLGSIIAGYIEYNPDEATREILLLLDTNFIVGLIDLNTEESTHTCNTLIKIAKQQNFKVIVLKDTIEETTHLLEAKATHFDKTFLQKKVNKEDIYNACDRRNLSRADLERITDNLESSLSKYGVSVLPYTENLKQEAKFTEEYKALLKVRNSKFSAMHDAIAVLYIKKHRKKRIKDFDKVNAWFVNNSISRDGSVRYSNNGFQPESIKADDLLNILWLSNPQINDSIKADDLADIGLTSSISMTFNSNLPKAKILRELDDNIHKYAKEEISDTDVIRVATRITNRQLNEIEELNELAEQDKAEFIKRLEDEANKQKLLEENRIQKLESVFKNYSIKSSELEKVKVDYLTKSETANEKVNDLEKRLLVEQNSNREIKRKEWINNKIYKWRRKSWIEFSSLLLMFFFGILYILYHSSWEIEVAVEYFKELKSNVLISGGISILVFFFLSVTVKTLFGKYRNHSNIQNFIKGLDVPEKYIELK